MRRCRSWVVRALSDFGRRFSPRGDQHTISRQELFHKHPSFSPLQYRTCVCQDADKHVFLVVLVRIRIGKGLLTRFLVFRRRSQILPQYMNEAGYESHMVGKWHLGNHNESSLPNRRGFKTYMGYLNGEDTYYTHKVTAFALRMLMLVHDTWPEVRLFSSCSYAEHDLLYVLLPCGCFAPIRYWLCSARCIIEAVTRLEYSFEIGS